MWAIGSFAQGNNQSTSENKIKYGIRGAFNLSHISGTSIYGNNGNSTSTATVNSGTLPGFAAGFFALIPLRNEFEIQPELDYSLKGGKYTGSDMYFNYELKLKLGYISIPILFKWQPADVAGFNVFAGPEFGFLASAKGDNTTTSTGAGAGGSPLSEVIDEKNQLKSLDFGLDFGLGYNFMQKFGVDVRYGLGLTNIAKPISNPPSYGTIEKPVARNRTIQIGLSYLLGK